MKKSKTLKQVMCRGIHILCLILIPVFMISCAGSGFKKETEMKHEHAYAPRTITGDMTCPVCGMYPARDMKWHSEIIFKDGSFAAFDGCKDMFKFLLEMGRYDKDHNRDDVAAAYVRDLDSGEWIDAGDALFVIGSSVMGPMGKEIVPFSSHMKAMKFMKKYGGTMGRYSEITIETIKSLGMGGMQMKGHGHDEQQHH